MYMYPDPVRIVQDPDVRSKLDKTKEDLRRMQSEKDKAVNAVNALKRKGQATPRGKGGGGGGRSTSTSLRSSTSCRARMAFPSGRFL